MLYLGVKTINTKMILGENPNADIIGYFITTPVILQKEGFLHIITF